MGEHRYVFQDEEAPVSPGKHPYIRDNGLYVRGRRVLSFEQEHDTIDRLTVWGAAFTVFAEKITYARCRNTATLLACVILKTDRLVGAKVSKVDALLRDLEA